MNYKQGGVGGIAYDHKNLYTIPEPIPNYATDWI